MWTMRLAALALVAACTCPPPRTPATTAGPPPGGAATPAPTPATQPAQTTRPDLPGQGQPCAEGKCQEGLTCIAYFGIAGARGPKFVSCEIPCPVAESQCPEGQRCVTIADGPGRVCRP